MNDEQNNNTFSTIHDFDYNLICDFYLGLDRQGPGSVAMTRRALGFVEGLDAGSRIADLGCGTGGQTMTLAGATAGRITGVDLFAPFIDRLNQQAWERGVHDRVQGVVGSMDALPFEPRSLDLIWCEGAIYSIGFERGLSYWREFLRPGGWVAVTENTWFTGDGERPDEIEAFWQAAYAEIGTVEAKIAAVRRAGYEFVAAFVLPDSCWEDFYAPFPGATEAFLRRHSNSPAAEAFVAGEAQDKLLWDRHKAHYGYVFYIARKPY